MRIVSPPVSLNPIVVEPFHPYMRVSLPHSHCGCQMPLARPPVLSSRFGWNLRSFSSQNILFSRHYFAHFLGMHDLTLALHRRAGSKIFTSLWENNELCDIDVIVEGVK